jgi:hypothetical protein
MINVDVFDKSEDYVTWSIIFEILSIERFKFFYTEIGLPAHICLNAEPFAGVLKQCTIEFDNTFSQGRHAEFKELQSCFTTALSKLEILYGETCVLELLEWCDRYMIDNDQVNIFFFWSLIMKDVLTFKDHDTGLISDELIEKIGNIILPDKYCLDKSDLENKLYEVSKQPMTDWENQLSASHQVTEELPRYYLSDSLSPYLVGCFESILLIGGYHQQYTILNQLRAVFSDSEAKQFLCWARSQVDEEEFSMERIIYPS